MRVNQFTVNTANLFLYRVIGSATCTSLETFFMSYHRHNVSKIAQYADPTTGHCFEAMLTRRENVSAVTYQILLMAGFPGLVLSSKGKRPVSSWCAMTPADQMSEAGTTAELSTSGAMNLQHHNQRYNSAHNISTLENRMKACGWLVTRNK